MKTKAERITELRERIAYLCDKAEMLGPGDKAQELLRDSRGLEKDLEKLEKEEETIATAEVIGTKLVITKTATGFAFWVREKGQDRPHCVACGPMGGGEPDPLVLQDALNKISSDRPSWWDNYALVFYAMLTVKK